MNRPVGLSRPSTGRSWAGLTWWRRRAWVVMVLADLGLAAWGLGAAALPEQLLGPGGKPILPAGYEGYSGLSWTQLEATSSDTAGYITLVFRMYGIYIVAFGVLAATVAATALRRGERWAWWALLTGNSLAYIAAMTYDRIVGAIGPFEWAEYLGLAAIYASLALTAPYGRHARPPQTTTNTALTSTDVPPVRLRSGPPAGTGR